MIPRFRCVDAHGAVDVLERPLTEIVKGELGLAPYLLEGIGSKIDATRLALILDPCSHVDAVTENVISVDDDVADVDAHTELDPLFLRYRGVAFDHGTLDLNGTPHRG
jgi:hypothetical protein